LTRDSHFLQYSSLFIIFKCKIQRIFQNWKNTLDFLDILSTVCPTDVSVGVFVCRKMQSFDTVA
ncbi:hypothetical protein KG091_08935, partial [Carnobacteriaceae bacterium zg-ZUI78]|nr:hypothetical protein [Carnobacteriaceae bacterium zg-ZUI78]